MGHRVEDDINAKRVGALFREFMEEILEFLFAFPAISIVCVVAGDCHHTPLLVEESSDVNVTTFFAIMDFPCDACLLAPFARTKIGRLKSIFRAAKIEDTMKDGMVHRQLDEVTVGQNAFHLLLKVLPLTRTPKIVRHKKAAVAQIFL